MTNMNSRATAKCPEKDCAFSGRLDNWRRHLLEVHGYFEDEIQQLKLAFKTVKAEQKGRTLSECVHCGHICGTRDGIVKHIKKSHPNYDPDMTKNIKPFVSEQRRDEIVMEPARQTKEIDAKRVKCPVVGCPHYSTSRTSLCQHFVSVHRSTDDSTSWVLEKAVFDSKKKFEIWLAERREATRTTLVKQKRLTEGHLFTDYYKCSCEGSYESQATKKLGHPSIKITGSAYCTTFLKVELDEIKQQYRVIGCFSHYGHVINVARLKYTTTQIEIIMKMLDEGFYNSQIVRKLRKEHEKNSRLRFTTIEDIRVLRARFNMFPGRFDKNDLKSVYKRVERNSPEDGIRFFTKPVNQTGEEFRLVVVTPLQLQYLKNFGDRAVVLDDTHNCTQYELKLTTLMVMTDKDRGFPAAFLLSNTTTTGDVKHLFQVIRNLHPQFSPGFVMSDEAQVFWNAYIEVFPENIGVSQKLLCRWHIFRSWKKKATSCLQGVYLDGALGKLISILRTPSPRELNESINELLEFLRLHDSMGAKQFSEYFITYYHKKIDQWATAFREGTPLHTSMYAESWHSMLKIEFLDNKNNIRADHLLFCLYEAVQTIHDRREIEDARELAKSNPRKCVQREKHRQAMNDMQYYVVRLKDDDSVSVTRNGYSEVHTVKDKGPCDCDEKENTHCNYCEVCAYRFSCSCKDQIAGVSCKHAHMAVLKFSHELNNVAPPDTDEPSSSDHTGVVSPPADSQDPNESLQHLSDNNVDANTTAPEEIEDHNNSGNDIHLLSNLCQQNDEQNLKDELSSKLTRYQNLTNVLDESMRKLAKQPTDANLDRMNKVMKLLEEASEVCCSDVNVALPVRKDVSRNRNAKRQTARETMNEFKLEPKKKAKKAQESKNFYPSIAYDKSAMEICDFCKKSESPNGTPNDSWVHCFNCEIAAHEICVKIRRNVSCNNCDIGSFDIF